MVISSIKTHSLNYNPLSTQKETSSFIDTLSSVVSKEIPVEELATDKISERFTIPDNRPDWLKKEDSTVNNCFGAMLSMWNDTTVNEDISSQTDKALNVVSSGEHLLTDAEINDLKSKYDVTNLSRLDYYNLMADMTNLNAISSREALYGYLKNSPSCLKEISGSFGWSMSGEMTKYKQYEAAPNMIERLIEERKRLQAALDYVLSGDFARDNALLCGSETEMYTASFAEHYIEEYEENERMLAIFGQLLPEGSEWAEAAKPVPVRLTPKSSEEDAPDIGGISGEEAMNRDFSVPSKELLLGLIGKCSLLPGQWNSPVSELLEFLEEENSRKKDHPLAV